MSKLSVMTVLVAALLMCSALSAEENEKPRPKQLRGVLTAVESATITVTQRGDSGERTSEFTFDKNTAIEIETAEDEVVGKGEGGKDKIRPKREKIRPTGSNCQYLCTEKIFRRWLGVVSRRPGT